MKQTAHSERRRPAILFDLDGTLVDSVYQHVLTWGESFAHHGINIPLWKIHRHVGMSGKFMAPKLLREAGVKNRAPAIAELEKQHSKNFEKRLGSIRVFPGADELLRRLSKLDVPCSLATSGNRAHTNKLLKHLNVPASFPVITGDDAEKAKPAPDLFILAAEALRIPTTDCIVVGDSLWDMLAGQRMKAFGVGLLCGGYSAHELVTAGANRVYESPLGLLENLADLGIYAD